MFFDFEYNFSFFTIHGLFKSTIQKSASVPVLKFPLLIFKIFAGLEVKALIKISNFTEPLWYSSKLKGNNVSIPEAPVSAWAKVNLFFSSSSGLWSDTITSIVPSDKKPEDEEQKRLTFAQAETGASGIETLLSLSLELYHNGSVKLETIIKALTSNPAKILKINKGTLSVGSDADFCIVDLNKPWIVKKENLYSKSKNTSIENKKLQGKVMNTFVKGEELFKL